LINGYETDAILKTVSHPPRVCLSACCHRGRDQGPQVLIQLIWRDHLREEEPILFIKARIDKGPI
jgi:hypothetical protein